ncbi:MAG TPA: tetratricopeptide repeat protein, partial [Alphaproteobacteria bacterium]|nr:tetratricopeptide repeat protein [Alphaproteobacteria bacterium]
LANELSQLDRNNEAEALLRDCLAAHPEHALAWNTLGAILMAESRYGEASEAFEQAAWLQPGLIAARQNLARCHVQMHDLSGAVRIFRALLDDCPDNPLIYSDCALVLLELGDLAQAERVQRRALAIDPGCKAGWSNLAIIFERTGRWADCLDAAQHAIALEPGDPIPHVSAALASHKLYRPAEAEAEARRALETGGDNPGVLHSIGRLYEGMKRADLALELYRQAQAVEPGHMMSKARLFDLALSICDWSDYETMARQQVEHLKAELAKPGSQLNIDVFNLQALPISYELVGRAARKAARQIAAEARQFWSGGGFAHVRRRRKRIRLGYALAYTWYHSLPLVLRGVIAAHDRERFEVFGYSIRTSDGSDFCREYRGAFDRFRDVPGASPQDAAAQIREDGIDVLIDTTGLTSITCLPLCSLRPAPVQVHGFGYSITTGADYIDYLVTDRTYIPPEWEKVGTEKLIYLPDSFMPAVRLEEDLPARSRAEHGLPEDAVVFCNFNHPCKFEPESFAAWMRVLRQVPGSVLWLGGWLDETRGNLRREAGRHGVDPERLLFADIATHPEHMARLALADLGLDNLRHGGGVTTLDALWAGVPVLTVTGNTPAARLGATLVGAAGMPELALPDLAAYEARAVALARDRAALETVQRKLREQRDRCALFNIPGYTRHLEAGLTAAWETWLAGESPRRIDVATLT